jgi:hypothetical protein
LAYNRIELVEVRSIVRLHQPQQER